MTKHMPGLELDKLIAEKVLGWWQDGPEGGPRAWWVSPDDPEKSKALPYFSRDIKDAWSLAERFRLCVVPFQQEYWIAFPTQAYHSSQKFATNAPHAICLAALALVGVELENVEKT